MVSASVSGKVQKYVKYVKFAIRIVLRHLREDPLKHHWCKFQLPLNCTLLRIILSINHTIFKFRNLIIEFFPPTILLDQPVTCDKVLPPPITDLNSLQGTNIKSVLSHSKPTSHCESIHYVVYFFKLKLKKDSYISLKNCFGSIFESYFNVS